MAECYHFDCKPANASNDSFRTIKSQYPGTCQGCGQPYEKLDKIAYFGNGNNTSRPAGNPPSSGSQPPQNNSAIEGRLTALEKENKELKRRIERMDMELTMFANWLPILDGADWKQIPRKSQQPTIAPPEPAKPTTNQIEQIFKGTEVDTAANPTVDDIDY